MASHVTQGKLIIHDENLDVHPKKVAIDGNIKSSKPATKKGGVPLGHRKALNDITNKSSFHHEASSLKKNLPKEEFNVAEERFLHDHKKCIEEQQTSMNTFLLDMVLPGHDFVSNAEYAEVTQAKTDPDSPRCYPEPEELPMSEFSDWLESLSQWNSPPSSPICRDSPLLSPFAWQFEAVEFMLKQENEA